MRTSLSSTMKTIAMSIRVFFIEMLFSVRINKLFFPLNFPRFSAALVFFLRTRHQTHHRHELQNGAASSIPNGSCKRSNCGKLPSGRTISIHPTLTFGVEFEFLLATVSDPSKDLGCPDGKPQTSHFSTFSLEDYEEIYAQAAEDKEAEAV